MSVQQVEDGCFSHPLSMWCPKEGQHIAVHPTNVDVNKDELWCLFFLHDVNSLRWCLLYPRWFCLPFDEDIEEHDYLDVSSTFHNDDDSRLLDVVDVLHNADDGVDKDVHIGRLIWVHIPDDHCLNDGVVELHDELVGIGDDQRNVKDEAGFDVVGDVALEVVDEVLEVGFYSTVDVWSAVDEMNDVQLR